MNKVYLVWSGCYSDKDVQGVFSDRDVAEAKAATVDEGRVEEREVDAATRVTRLPRWSVCMLRDGTVTNEPSDTNYGRIDGSDWGDQERDLDWREQNGSRSWHLVFYVTTETADGAIKIANERRGWLIANGRWDRP